MVDGAAKQNGGAMFPLFYLSFAKGSLISYVEDGWSVRVVQICDGAIAVAFALLLLGDDCLVLSLFTTKFHDCSILRSFGLLT
jgi:hypothetical protein